MHPSVDQERDPHTESLIGTGCGGWFFRGTNHRWNELSGATDKIGHRRESVAERIEQTTEDTEGTENEHGSSLRPLCFLWFVTCPTLPSRLQVKMICPPAAS